MRGTESRPAASVAVTAGWCRLRLPGEKAGGGNPELRFCYRLGSLLSGCENLLWEYYDCLLNLKIYVPVFKLGTGHYFRRNVFKHLNRLS